MGILNQTKGATMNQELGRRGQTKGKAAKLVKAKPQRQNCTAMVQLRWPTADLQVNSDY